MKIVPILAGLLVGYIFALTQGLVDLTPVREAAWFAIPNFTLPKFSGSIQAITMIAPLAIATMVEHLGDIEAIGRAAGKDFVQDQVYTELYLVTELLLPWQASLVGHQIPPIVKIQVY